MKTENISIKSWSLEDRPREKLEFNGSKSLSNVELLAIILGSGSKDETAVELARRILMSVDNRLDNLSNLSMQELMKFKGVGKAKSVSILAFLELSRRKSSIIHTSKPIITDSHGAYLVIRPKLIDLDHEQFFVMYLNQRNEILKSEQISIGGTSSTIIDTKIIMRKALLNKASALILAHNHPSGQLKPSIQDKEITKKLQKAAEYFDLRVLDHLIIAGSSIFSFKDECLM